MERTIESGIVRAAKYIDIELCLLLRCIITCKYTLYCFDIGNELVSRLPKSEFSIFLDYPMFTSLANLI